MNDNKISFLLGIDGGGTKTEFLLTDINKKVIKRIKLGASNPSNIGIDKALAVLTQGIKLICEDIAPSEISVFAGIAGSGNDEIQNSIYRHLKSLGFAFAGNSSDTFNALKAALDDNDGIAVIMGTGTVAFGRSGTELFHSGGYGYMIDKGGSGFCLGSDALNSAFEFSDQRGGSEIIYELISEKLGKPLNKALSDIYSKGPSFVASLAPIVFEAFRKNDKAAKDILFNNTLETAKMIRSICSKKDSLRDNIVFIGGLCREKEILEQFLRMHLDDSYHLFFSDEPIINGAVSLAYELIKR